MAIENKLLYYIPLIILILVLERVEVRKVGHEDEVVVWHSLQVDVTVIF